MTSYAYDRRDNVVGVADPRSNEAGGVPEANAATDTKQRVAYAYDDADNQVLAVEDPDGLELTTQTGYDANDNVSVVISPRGMQETDPDERAKYFTQYTYDSRDKPLTITRGGTRTTAYAYYDDGQVLSVTAPKGVATHDPETAADDHDTRPSTRTTATATCRGSRCRGQWASRARRRR